MSRTFATLSEAETIVAFTVASWTKLARSKLSILFDFHSVSRDSDDLTCGFIIQTGVDRYVGSFRASPVGRLSQREFKEKTYEENSERTQNCAERNTSIEIVEETKWIATPKATVDFAWFIPSTCYPRKCAEVYWENSDKSWKLWLIFSRWDFVLSSPWWKALSFSKILMASIIHKFVSTRNLLLTSV